MWEMPPIYNDLPYNSNQDPYQQQNQPPQFHDVLVNAPLGTASPNNLHSANSRGNSVGHEASPVVDQGELTYQVFEYFYFILLNCPYFLKHF